MATTMMQNYGIQIAIALVLFIVGLIFLLVWAIIYSNRLANDLDVDWWIWLFLGLGLFFILVGLIWLIIVQYLIASKARELYEKVLFYEGKSPTDTTVKGSEVSMSKNVYARPEYPKMEYPKSEFTRPTYRS